MLLKMNLSSAVLPQPLALMESSWRRTRGVGGITREQTRRAAKLMDRNNTLITFLMNYVLKSSDLNSN